MTIASIFRFTYDRRSLDPKHYTNGSQSNGAIKMSRWFDGMSCRKNEDSDDEDTIHIILEWERRGKGAMVKCTGHLRVQI